MALRRPALPNSMRSAFRSAHRALSSHQTGYSSTVGAAAAATVPEAASAGPDAPGRIPDSVTSKFGDPSFWEGEYSSQYNSQQERQPFEWFLPYEGGLQQHLLPFLASLPVCKKLLHIGCGTSDVGPKLASEPGLDVHVVDADNSPSAMRIMRSRHKDVEKYSCNEADALNLPFPEGSFDAIVDKGTMDALLCRNTEDAQAMAVEAHRVLAKGGVFVQVTTEDPEARLDLLTGSAARSHEPWARSLFKEIGEGAQSTYFMYVLVK